MYRLILESLLGLRLEVTPAGALLHVHPCIPADWPGFTVAYRFREALYEIQVERADVAEVSLDGVVCAGEAIALLAGSATHQVRVRLARTQTAAVAAPESAPTA
jgi:cellobiose phosphorylase